MKTRLLACIVFALIPALVLGRWTVDGRGHAADAQALNLHGPWTVDSDADAGAEIVNYRTATNLIGAGAAAPTNFLRLDGSTAMQGDLALGDHDARGVRSLKAGTAAHGPAGVTLDSFWPYTGLDQFAGRITITNQNGAGIVLGVDYFGNLMKIVTTGPDAEEADHYPTYAETINLIAALAPAAGATGSLEIVVAGAPGDTNALTVYGTGFDGVLGIPEPVVLLWTNNLSGVFPSLPPDATEGWYSTNSNLAVSWAGDQMAWSFYSPGVAHHALYSGAQSTDWLGIIGALDWAPVGSLDVTNMVTTALYSEPVIRVQVTGTNVFLSGDPVTILWGGTNTLVLSADGSLTINGEAGVTEDRGARMPDGFGGTFDGTLHFRKGLYVGATAP